MDATGESRRSRGSFRRTTESIRFNPMMDRRTFLSRITVVLSGGVALLMSLPVFRFFADALTGSRDAGWYTVARTGSSQLSEEVNQVQYTRVLREGWLTRT